MGDPCPPLASTPEQPPLKDDYREQVADRLTGVLNVARRSSHRSVDVDKLKIVVFSDHHKGARDGADDFQRCERAYCAALGYYLESGYELFVLGDAEELWEEKPEAVTRCYHEVLELEGQFLEAGRGGMERFFGNHDDLWAEGGEVRKHLRAFFGDLKVRESLLISVTEKEKPRGELFFAHGHQGTTESDKLGAWARLPVRYLWRPLQRKLGYSATTPASDYGLRGTHDRAMFEWACGQEAEVPLVLVTGHTHRPVFSLPRRSTRSIEDIEAELADAAPEMVPGLRAELEHARAVRRDRNAAALTVSPPCYFNTGCCSFPDGDVTGLEIEGGELRLVRWPDDEEQPRRRPLARKALREVFAEVAGAEPTEGSIEELVL